MPDPKLHDEAGRIRALRCYRVLDTPGERVFDRITSLIQDVLGMPMAFVSLIDVDRQWFKSRQEIDVPETPRKLSFCTQTIQGRETLVVPDATRDARFCDNPAVTGDPYIRSYVGVPLETPDGYNVGTLCAVDLKPREFDAATVDLLRSFGRLVVDELELRMIASTDGLTGALTRRRWIEAAKTELARCRRYGGSASVALFDIDHFRSVNGTFGHSTGDDVISDLVERCMRTCREVDSVGRIGGEEFAILLPHTPEARALELAERLRATFAAEPVVSGSVRVSVTASFGVAGLEPGYQGPEEWLSCADGARHMAKRFGRNRCLAAGARTHLQALSA